MPTIALSRASFATSGVSDAARYASDQAGEVEHHIRTAISIGNGMQAATEDLLDVCEECREANWDGHQAEPLRSETYRQGYLFLEALPPGIPAPEIAGEPDEHLSFEWYQGPRRTLSVSLSAERELHYAAIIGPNKSYGTEAFFGDVPNCILDLIARIYGA